MTGRLSIAALALLFACLLKAQPADTTARATVQTPDSGAVADTTFRMRSPVLTGTLNMFLEPSRYIDRSELPWIAHRFLGDILGSFPGVYLADQQSEGQYSRLSVRGSDWRSIAVMRDGRLLNDPASGIYNLYGFSTEYADRIELVPGPRAFVYGLNSTGATVNLVTRNYNSNRPLSNLAYSESGYNYSRTDGLFSQNISHTVNITAGFQAQSTDGRFPNALHEQWNSRVKLRYNPFSELQVILSHYFTGTNTGLNGGVNILASGGVRAFDPLQAVMVNTDAYEKVTRHDLDLSLIGTFLADTASTSTLTLYYSHQLREYRDEENRFFPNGVSIHSDHTSSWAGVSLKQTLMSGMQRFQAGASGELRQVEGSPNIGRRRNTTGSIWGIEELLLGEETRVAGFGRLERYLHGTYGGVGADARVALLSWLSASGGLSHSRRLPTYQELYWTGDSVTRKPDIHAERHLVAEAGIDLRCDSTLSLHAAWFHRTIEDPIVIVPTDGSGIFPSLEFANAGRIRTEGIEAAFRLRFWVLTVDGTGTYVTRKDQDGTRLGTAPRVSGQGGLYYWNTVLDGHLTIKAGVRGRYQSGSAGEVFNPEVGAYVPNTIYEPGQGSAVDFLLFARIGDAHIHFLWTNLTSARYFITPFYPVRDREIRFGLTWQFLD
jgi:outer membrane cobalamin receptor